MTSIKIIPTKLNGKITAPPSKSLSHRAIICASLCIDGGESKVDNVILSEDIKATVESMRNLGTEIKIVENANKTYCLYIKRNNKFIKDTTVDCRESGSTLRFLIPIALSLLDSCTFTGKGKLVERPLDDFYKIFKENNIHYKNNDGKLPLSVSGKLKSGVYELSGSISSQFISGLLFALPLLENDSTIKITDKLQSVGYVDLTINMLKHFGVNIVNNDYKEFKIHGSSNYKSSNYFVEGDFSQGAFFLTSHSIGNNIECHGLNENSLQGDKEILDIIKQYEKNDIDEIIIDASQIPDLVPILAVNAALKNGVTTKIINAERLRIKESDRLNAISTEMNKLGANIIELNDGLIIKGQNLLKGNAIVNSHNDHRIAMSLAIAATKCENEIILQDYMSVNKSYPEFWNDYKSLGGVVSELDLGK